MSKNKKCIKHNIYFNEKFGCEHCRIEALEQNSLPKAIYEGLIRANVNGFNKHVDEISDLKFNVDNLMKFQEGYINRIIKLEHWKKEQYTKDFNYLNKEVCDRFNELNELKERIEKLENDSFYWREKVSSKDSKPDSNLHCFCCGTDITDETNCFCLTCFNDKIAHDIKKDIVISRELFGEVQDFMGLLGHSNDNDVIDAKYAKNLYMKLKEVEK